jgi:Mce-associated membrane protein
MSRSGITRTAALVAVLFGTFTGVSAAAQQDGTGPGNRAFIDAAATQDALASATQLSTDLFTFSYTEVKEHEAKFGRLTTGDFTNEYGKLFNDVIAQAQTQKLSLTSTVKGAAVRELRDGQAEVLVFLDQAASSAGTGQATTSTTMFTATIKKVDDEWKFADIDLFEAK